jgi:putative colanic acid biosynthesis glycosyltransferase
MKKKRILEVSAVPYGSTGKIIQGIATEAKHEGFNVYQYYSWTHLIKKNDPKAKIYVGSFAGKAAHITLSKITGLNGYFSVSDTLRLIEITKKIKPDIIHMHILHSWYINLPLWFKFLKEFGCPVIWTMHDCWAFTGQCPNFLIAKCDKWKTGCYECPQYTQYPQAYVDRTKKLWKKKKEWFNSVPEMVIVTPSEWLAGLVKMSFLKDYPVKVIHNGIDTNVFKPTPSDFRKKYGIADDKILILSVAYKWTYNKGFDTILRLIKELDSKKYSFVLVGTDDDINKELEFPNVVSIHRTDNQQELAEIYSAADLFVNATREDNYPTVNIESEACGTPVLTFDVGGSAETVYGDFGKAIKSDNIEEMKREIESFNKSAAPTSVKSIYDMLDQKISAKEYINIIKQVIKKDNI